MLCVYKNEDQNYTLVVVLIISDKLKLKSYVKKKPVSTYYARFHRK